jgi:hypothetical protein
MPKRSKKEPSASGKGRTEEGAPSPGPAEESTADKRQIDTGQLKPPRFSARNSRQQYTAPRTINEQDERSSPNKPSAAAPKKKEIREQFRESHTDILNKIVNESGPKEDLSAAINTSTLALGDYCHSRRSNHS